MVMKPLQSGIEPIGQFDGYDADMGTLMGGEVGTLLPVTWTFPPGASVDKAAYDAFLKHNGGVAPTRTVVTHTLNHPSAAIRPLMLLDEGTTGYGMLFGTVVGGTVGQNTAGTVLGYHSTTGSGKVTCWDKPGFYGVSLDACAASVTVDAAAGILPGTAMFAAVDGKLTLTEAEAFDFTAPGTGTIVGRFHGLAPMHGSSLVTTPAHLAQGGNPTMTWLEFHFRVEN